MNPISGDLRGLSLAILAAVVLSACEALAPTDAPTDPDPPKLAGGDVSSQPSSEVPTSATEVPFTEVDTLFRSSVSGIVARRRQVIRTEDELDDAWAEATGRVVPAEAAPDVDFTASQVLLVAMGERTSGGYGIDISSLARSNDTLYAVVEEVSPGPSCLTTLALTQPVMMLRLPQEADEVVFLDVESVLDCS